MFFAVDPKKVDWSRYSYCSGNPVILIDPTGESPILIAILVAGVINVGLDYTLARISGSEYDWRDAGVSFVVGSGTALLGPSAPFLKGVANPVVRTVLSLGMQSAVSATGSQFRSSVIHKNESWTINNWAMRFGTDFAGRAVFTGVSQGLGFKGINPYAPTYQEALGGNARNLFNSTVNTFGRKLTTTGMQQIPTMFNIEGASGYRVGRNSGIMSRPPK